MPSQRTGGQFEASGLFERTHHLSNSGRVAVAGLEQGLEAGMVQAVAGGTGEFPGFAGLQHVGKGVAEVPAVEFAPLAQVAAVQGSATEVEFECPAAGQAEGVFQLPCGGFQQVRQVVLLNQGHR